MSTSNQSDIDSLLADYSEQVAEYGLNSTQEKQFYSKHSSDGEFAELAGVLRHLRESPPRIQSTGVSLVPARSRLRLGPLGFGLVFLSLIVSTTWLGMDRVMNDRGIGSPEFAAMNALGESAPSASTDDTVSEVAANDLWLATGARVDPDWQMLALQSPDLAHLAFEARSHGAGEVENLVPVMGQSAEAATLSMSGRFLASSGRKADPREWAGRLLVDPFMSDAARVNLLAEAFLRDATTSQPINLPKLNLAYAFARLAVSSDTWAPDAGSDDAVQPTSGWILDTYGRVLDTIAEAMEDQAEEGFILTLDRSSGETWQRVIAAFEATLEEPLIDEESKAAARRRIKTLTTAGTERNPAEDGN